MVIGGGGLALLAWMDCAHLLHFPCPQDGDKFWRMPECYIRGSTIKYLRIPDEIIDMVREEAAKGRGRGGPQQQKQQKGRGMGGAGRGGVPVRMRLGRDTGNSPLCTLFSLM